MPERVHTIGLLFSDLTDRRLLEEFNAHLSMFQGLKGQPEPAEWQGESMFQALVEQSLVGVYLFVEGCYLYVNQALADMTGYHVDEIVGKLRPLDLVHPDDHPLVAEMIRRRLSGEIESAHYSFRGMRKDGTAIHVEVFGRRVLYRGKVAILGTVVDITERVRAEERLRRYTERLRILREMDRAILEACAPEEIAHAVLRRIRQLVPCRRASVVLFDHERKEAHVLATYVNGETQSGTEVRFPLTTFRDIGELQDGRAYVVDDLTAISDLSEIDRTLLREGMLSYVSVPLVVKRELIGSLNLCSDQRGVFSEEHIEIAHEVADVVAIAIQQARLHERVQRHAEELEQRVAERTAELRRLVNAMAGREVRMAELKEVIRQLRAQLLEAGLIPVSDDPLEAGRRGM
jgi:PAS domain S-box-containing protein